MSDRRLDELATVLGQVHQDGDAWLRYCDVLTNIFGGVGTSMVPVDVPRRAFRTYYSPSLNAVLAEYQRDGWHDKDYRQRSAPVLLERGYALDTDIVTPQQMDVLPYYRDFLRKYGVGGFLGIHILTRFGSWCAAIQLPLGKLEPTKTELRLVPEICGMTEAAAERAVIAGAGHRFAWSESLRTTGHESAIAEVTGRLSAKSAGLDSMLATFGEIGERISLNDNATQQQLDAALAKCFDPDLDALLPEPLYLVSDTRKVMATFIRYPSTMVHFFNSPEIIILFRVVAHFAADTRAGPALHFGLTNAEMDLLRDLSRGAKIKVAAANLRITEGTARQRLKSIFRKTGTETQHELVAMLYQSAGYSLERYSPFRKPQRK